MPRHAQRPDLGQSVDGVAGPDEAVPQSPGDERGAGRLAEQSQRALFGDRIAHRVAVSSNGEGGSHSGQQGGMTKRLSLLEDVDDLVDVNQLHSATLNDEEVSGRWAVLDESVLPVLVVKGCGD